MKERCLITGSNGFLGSALAQELLLQDHEVTRVEHRYLGDIPRLTTLLERFNPQWIFHLAAFGNKYSQIDEMEIVQANIVGTMNLLQASRNIPYSALVNIGSSSEYGLKSSPMAETDSLDTDTFYGASKAASTLLCRAFAKRYHKPIVTARPFSVYGPGDDPSKFIRTVIRAAKHQEVLHLAPGMHDWIYISDFIAGLLAVAQKADQLQGQAVNIGSGRQYSNQAVVGIVKEILAVPMIVQKTDQLRDYDTTNSWVADNTLLRSLGWSPVVSLEEGLIRTINGESD